MTRAISSLTMKGAVAALSLASLATPGWSAEGMWTLDNPPTKAMQAELGWAPDRAWLDRAMRGAARLGAGCSSSFVSKNGLVLTNHHCVARCVEQLSTADRDLLKDGFLAGAVAEEKRCPALSVDRLEAITDVTADVGRATAGLTGTAYKNAQNTTKARLTTACVAALDERDRARTRCDVVDLYHGGQYKLYRYHRFNDVRLAFAPEQAMAFFGGDPDNFNFPRYDLDMALVRVYEEGKPAQVADWFAIDPQGPAAGDAVFTVGHPGSTQRELTVAQLSALRDVVILDQLLRTAEYRGVLLEYRTTGAEQARIANVELFGIENRYKVLKGELATLLDASFFERKQADERALRAFVAADPALAASTGGAWDAIAFASGLQRTSYLQRDLIDQGRAFNSVYFTAARTLVRGAAERGKANVDRLPEFNDNRLPALEAQLMSTAPIYPDLEKLKLTYSLTKLRELLGSSAPQVVRVLGKQSPSDLAADMIGRTQLGNVAVRRRLWEGGAAAIAASDDPFIRLAASLDPEARALRARYERDVEAVVQANTEKIAQARFAMAGDTTYPDATGTLRLSYGVVRGWDEGGQPVAPFTNFGGAFDHATGAAPFALPTSWLAHQGQLDLSLPLDFVSTNDIIGGNSGSPVLNRRGQLVGLAFDGNIHSLGGAYWYDGSLNRTVSVDSAAILQALDRIYGAKVLADEMRAN